MGTFRCTKMKVLLAIFSLVCSESQVDDEKFVEQQKTIESQFDPKGFESSMGTSGSINFQTPKPDSEEGGEQHMPNRHRCDACRIVGLYAAKKFQEKIDIYPSVKSGKKLLSESTVIELMEDLYDNDKSFEGAGVKVINGISRIAAPGFETAEVPGVTQGGMKWPHRFKTFCNRLMEDMGSEWDLYHLFRAKGEKMVYEMCYQGK